MREFGHTNVIFSSFNFIFFFLPLTFATFFILNTRNNFKSADFFLLASSLFFYGYWNINYVPLIICSIVFNYSLSLKISAQPNEKRKVKNYLFYFGVVFNLGVLFFFKYMDFSITIFNSVFVTDIQPLNLVLPLAISFFTFQQIAYISDARFGIIRNKNFVYYATFILFFPQLIAGPIVRYQQITPQLLKVRRRFLNARNIQMGLFIFSIGLFKKTVLADTFAGFVHTGFDVYQHHTVISAWASALSFTLQLYFDFSGYSDMAIGLALLFNIKLPINFNSPYKAQSIITFWERWHITLTKFIHQYIFTKLIRLTKNYTKTKGYVIVFITMMIMGMWHGANWMFVAFSCIHATALVTNHIWNQHSNLRLPAPIGWLATFLTVVISLVFFRAQTWTDAMNILSAMFGANGLELPYFLENQLAFLGDYGVKFGRVVVEAGGHSTMPLWIAAGMCLVLCFKNSNQLLSGLKPTISTAIFSSLIFSVALLYANQPLKFLYFNF